MNRKSNRWIDCECGEECELEGEYPKFEAWCEKCNNYARFDLEEVLDDVRAGMEMSAESFADSKEF